MSRSNEKTYTKTQVLEMFESLIEDMRDERDDLYPYLQCKMYQRQGYNEALSTVKTYRELLEKDDLVW